MPEDVFEIVGNVVGGSFKVQAVVAEGGFAVVYRAFHGAFHAPVALKCLKVPTVARSDQREFLERFREEGELLFRLSQSISSVVRPLHVDAFETARGVFVPYMALEWLDGDTLDVVIAKRKEQGRPPMTPKAAVRLLSPVARALERAHHFPTKDGPVSIIHRDLKPDNIVVASVNGEEVVKILDFGIAKVRSVASQAAGRLSQDGSAGSVPFTPGYAAPEQWFPKRYGQTGPWTDIWGLALTVVEILSSKPAIDGDHAAMMGTAVDERRRPSPRSEGVEVSDEVEEVFLKALAVDPRQRYHEVGQFWDDLEKAVGLQRSSPQYAGQPFRDSRTDGPSQLREERVEAAVDAQKRAASRSVRPPPMAHRQLGAETLDELPPVLGFGASSQIDAAAPDDFAAAPASRPVFRTATADLELDLRSAPPPADVPLLQPPVAARQATPRGERQAEVEPVSESELLLELEEVPRNTPSRQLPPAPAANAPAANASARTPPKAPPPPKIEEANDLAGMSPGLLTDISVRDNGETVSEASGLDLAISRDEVRRGSSTSLRAVKVVQPPGPQGGSSGIDLALPVADARRSSVTLKSQRVQPPPTGVSRSSAAGMAVPDLGSGPAAARSGRHAAMTNNPPLPAAAPSPSRKLVLPIAIASAGVLVALADYINASAGGGRWSLGPVPVNWIAGLLAVAGLALLLVRLFLQHMEE